MLKNNVKKIMVGTCATAFALLAVAGANALQTETVSANTANISMLAGGQIRTIDPMGLGFVTTVEKSYYAGLEGEVTTGTIIATKSALDSASLNSAESFTIAGVEAYNATSDVDVKLANIENQGWLAGEIEGVDSETQYAFRGSVVGLAEENAERTYCARGYICVNGEYTYTDYVEADHARSVQQVAYKATNDESYFAGQSNEVQAYIQSYLPEKSYEQTVPTLLDVAVDASALVSRETTREVVTDFGGVTGEYTGSALKITQPLNNGSYKLKVPQIYKEKLIGDYKKIGFYVAVEKLADKNYDHKDGVNFVAANAAKTPTLMGSKHFADTDFNSWIYVEKDISALESSWTAGEIELLTVWASNSGVTDQYKDSFNLYIGDVKLISQADLDAEKKGILDGVTNENAAQYQLGTATGTFMSANDLKEYGLGGGYTGNAVEFNANMGSVYAVELPASCLPADTTDKYFSMWFALRTVDKATAMTGLIQVNTGVAGAFAGSYTYASGNRKVDYAKFDGNEANYQTDTWYQLMVPVSKITADLYLTGTNYLKLWQFWESGFNIANYKVLIGDIGIVDVATPEGYMLKVNAIEQDSMLSKAGTYLSETDVSALGFAGDYSGAAILVENIRGDYVLKLTEEQVKSYISSGYTKIGFWYASDTGVQLTGRDGSLFETGTIKITNDTLNTWLYTEVDISRLGTVSEGAYTMPSFSATSGGVILYQLWNLVESYNIYIGDIILK